MIYTLLHFFGYHKPIIVLPLTDILNIEKCLFCSQLYVNDKGNSCLGRLKIEDVYTNEQQEYIKSKVKKYNER